MTVMAEWKKDNLEKIKITIEIPKNTIAFVINAFSKDNGKINMFNAQYGSEEVEKLKGDINENKYL